MGKFLRAHAEAGRPQMATLYGDHTIRMAREISDAATELNAIHVLSAFLGERGFTHKALSYLERGLELATEIDDWTASLNLNIQAGFFHYTIEELDEAQDCYTRALMRARQLNAPLAEGQLLGRIGAIRADRGDLDGAVEAAETALALAAEHEDLTLLGEQHVLLAMAHADMDQAYAAVDYCRQAVAAFEESGNNALLKQAQTLLAALENGP